MYILPDKYTLDNTPKKYTSNLVQYHEHDNLCFNAATATSGPQVRGLTRPDGTCGTMFGQQLTKFNPNIQVHVWIRANDCGPFASLLGVGAGQIKTRHAAVVRARPEPRRPLADLRTVRTPERARLRRARLSAWSSRRRAPGTGRS